MRFFGKLAGVLRGGFCASLILALFIGVAGPACATKSTQSKPDVLWQASEIAEQLSENASTIDASAFGTAMSDISRLDARLKATLPPDRKRDLDGLVVGIRNAWAAEDRSAVGVQSIEVYRLLEEAVPRGTKGIPVQVAQLDYVGFKVNALLSANSIDWNQIDVTVRQAHRWWAAIEPQSSDVTLNEAMNRSLLGMKEAADQKDVKVMHFGADMELILVDGLETFFLAHPRSH